jgi:hypothetical protein
MKRKWEGGGGAQVRVWALENMCASHCPLSVLMDHSIRNSTVAAARLAIIHHTPT